MFKGYIPNPELPAWYRACDFYVLPSQSEGLSIALLEAMACGKPVITTFPSTGMHDAIRPDENGLLIQHGDIEALIAAMHNLDNNPDFALTLGEAARKSILRGFTWKPIAKQTLAVYQEVHAQTGFLT